MSTKLKSSRSTYTIVVDNLRLKYRVTNGSVNAINGISFKIKPGEVLGIVGESGCGKTSIALSLIKLLPKNVSRFSGQISLQGKPVKKISEKLFRKQIRWKKISMVFQGAMNSLNPVIRVGNQIIEPLILNKHDKNLAKEKAIELLKRNSLKGVKQWKKGKLIMGRDYNGFLAFIYFLKINKYILKYISLQQSNLLPKLDFVYNGEKK